MMAQLGRSRLTAWLCVVLVASWIALPARADVSRLDEGAVASQGGEGDSAARADTTAASPAAEKAGESRAMSVAGDVSADLERAREHINNAKYAAAIEILKEALDRAQAWGQTEALREAYLLLIKSYVYQGNDFKQSSGGRAMSDLNYGEAQRLIAQCLENWELRHTWPDPVSDPPEMIRFFEEVRAEKFGSFRVTGLEPRDATVRLDNETLRTLTGESVLGDVDIRVGPHTVTVSAPGYRDRVHEINILSNTIVAESYQLSRRRSRSWYAAVGTGALGVVGGVIALVARGGKPAASTQEPLGRPPAPPDPPPAP